MADSSDALFRANQMRDIIETIPLNERSRSENRYLQGLGRKDAYSTVICNIIGSGIFSTPGIVFAAAGSPCASIIVWLFSGILSIIGALCYVELVTGHVNSAAEAAYFEKAFHKSMSFSFLVVSFFALSSGSIAIEATVFGQYFLAMFNIESAFVQGTVSVALICVLAHLNLKGVEQSALIQQAMVVFKVTAVVMIIAALCFIPDSVKTGFNFSSVSECFDGTTPGGFGLGILGALWAYSGYNSVCALSEEFRDPRKDIPFGVLFGMVTVIILYLFCNFAYIRVIDPAILKTSDSIGYTFAMKVGGEAFAVVLSFAIMLATMGAAHSTVFGQARLFHAAGRDGLFHEWFGRVNRAGIPVNSTLALCAWSCVLVLLGNNLSILINYSGIATWLFAAMAGLAVIHLRQTSDRDSFHIPCFPASPATFSSACLAVVLSGFVTDFYPTLIVFSMMSAAVIYYIVKFGWKPPIFN